MRGGGEGQLTVTDYESITVMMRVGGMKFPGMQGQFVVEARKGIQKKSTLRAVLEAAVELAHERGRMVKKLEREYKLFKEGKQKAEERWTAHVESEVRAHVRQARRDLLASVFVELSKLKRERRSGSARGGSHKLLPSRAFSKALV
eukprot:4724539-Pleurochrysis_carterae.AAC.4